MATLAAIRTALNGEVGVVTDADTTPWTVAVRNQAISDGYAALWRFGVRKDAKQDITSVTDQWNYPLTSIRMLNRVEILDSSSRVIDKVGCLIEPDGSGTGTHQLRLKLPITSGYTIRVWGYAPYVYTFASDAAVDDLPADFGRIPRLKAKAILYRIKLGDFARYENREVVAPEMSMTVGEMIGLVAATEREFIDEAKNLAGLRARTGRTRSL